MGRDLAAWVARLDDLFGLVAGRFSRTEPRLRARMYVRGLLAPLAGKNGWTLAEAAGDLTPDGMQRLLNKAAWDVDGVRDDVRSYAVDHLGDPDGVLIVDETGFLKKGVKSAGVQHQYSGLPARWVTADEAYGHITLAMLAHTYLAVTTAISPNVLAANSSRSPSASTN